MEGFSLNFNQSFPSGIDRENARRLSLGLVSNSLGRLPPFFFSWKALVSTSINLFQRGNRLIEHFQSIFGASDCVSINFFPLRK